MKHLWNYLFLLYRRWSKKGRTTLSNLGQTTFSLKELNYYSSFAKVHNNHAFYEDAIKKFDSELNFDEFEGKPRKFIGSGAGSGSLDAYRKIVISSDEALFEKVYYNHNFQLQKQLYFHETIDWPDHHFTIPQIQRIVSGKQLTAIYFNWLPFRELPVQLDTILRAYQQLYTIFATIPVPNKIPPYLRISKKHSYTKAVGHFKEWLAQHQGVLGFVFTCEQLQELLVELENTDNVIFSHGDLHHKNLGISNTLVDWDEWGFYPKPYDLAVMISHYKLHSFAALEQYAARFEEVESRRWFYCLFSVLYHAHQRKSQERDTLLLAIIKRHLSAH